MGSGRTAADLTPRAREAGTLDEYIATLVHAWCRLLSVLAGGLLLLFIPIDYLLFPTELFPQVLATRLIVVAIVFATYAVMRVTRPGRASYAFSHFLAALVGTMVAIFTTFTGGFESPYYAAFNLIIVAINLVLPWGLVHTILNTALLVALYVGFNLALPQDAPPAFAGLLNNLTFIACTSVFAVVGSALRQRLTAEEFSLRMALRDARDELWAEMGLAKQIQSALLPSITTLGNYDVAARMVPAEEVGGDYYDCIETTHGVRWVAIGDVTGHGVESGLISMMAQTSLLTAVNSTPALTPSEALVRVNATLFENMQRMQARLYMTFTALRVEPDRVVFAGQHQDILVWRARTREVETIQITGTWLGLARSIEDALCDAEIVLDPDDVLLLVTDGITEADHASGEMFGVRALADVFRTHAAGDLRTLVDTIVRAAVGEGNAHPDDATVVALKRRAPV